MDLSFTREIQIPVRDPKLASIDIKKFLIINVGETAPDFVMDTLDGKQVKLSELRGKVVLLDFWATWCGPCIAELPNVKKSYERFGQDGDFVVLGISLDFDKEPVREFVTKRKVLWPQTVLGPAEENAVAKLYNVSGIPATFLIDRDGKVVAKDVHGWRLNRELNKLFPKEREQVQTQAQASR